MAPKNRIPEGFYSSDLPEFDDIPDDEEVDETDLESVRKHANEASLRACDRLYKLFQLNAPLEVMVGTVRLILRYAVEVHYPTKGGS